MDPIRTVLAIIATGAIVLCLSAGNPAAILVTVGLLFVAYSLFSGIYGE